MLHGMGVQVPPSAPKKRADIAFGSVLVFFVEYVRVAREYGDDERAEETGDGVRSDVHFGHAEMAGAD